MKIIVVTDSGSGIRAHFLIGLLLLLTSFATNGSGQSLTPEEQQLIEAAGAGKVAQARELLARKVNPRVRDAEGRTPLHWACWGGHQTLAGELLTAGAEIDARDGAGNTPLDLAQQRGHSGLTKFLLEKGAQHGANQPAATAAAATAAGQISTGQTQTAPAPAGRELKPALKFKTLAEFESEIKEPAVLLDDANVCFFAPKRKEREAKIIFPYLIKAYEALYQIVGRHTEYKIAVYAFPKGNPHGWGGTSNCSIEYDEGNLDFAKSEEWQKYHVPHVSGYIEEMAHNFVHATHAQFGWEMLGWSIGAEVCAKLAPNPLYEKQLRQTRDGQRQTYERYMQNGSVLPADVPANQCDRIHAWLLRKCAEKYGPQFWPDFFTEIRKEAQPLADAAQLGDGDAIRNRRYQITVDCFERLAGLHFESVLLYSKISLLTDVKSLHPEKADWNRRLTEN